jgi:hypothetical protein
MIRSAEYDRKQRAKEKAEMMRYSVAAGVPSAKSLTEERVNHPDIGPDATPE